MIQESPEQIAPAKQIQAPISLVPLRNLGITVALLLAGGTLFYHFVEGWSLLDSFYFCAITLTTIGYGDFAPKTDPGKLVTVIYAFVGIGALAIFVSVIARNAILRRHEAQERRHQELLSAINAQQTMAAGD